MKNNNFLQKYLISVTDRLTMLAMLISFSFWLFGTIWQLYAFTGSLFDITFISLGLSSTLFLIACPTEESIRESFSKGVMISKTYLAQICNTLHALSMLWLWSGLVTLIAMLFSKKSVTDFAILPEIFGVFGIIIILFCPTEDIIEDN